MEEEPLPKKIYKYRTINQHLYEMIINHHLWFSNPPDFNDPYDCNVAFNNKTYSNEDIESFWNQITPEQHEILKKHGAKTKNDWIINKELINLEFTPALRNLMNAKGLCCFSETNESIIMWSHYADSHKGLCITFDTEILRKNFPHIFRINYDSFFPKTNLLTDLSESIRKIMIHKSKQWEYEKEIRLIGPNKASRIFITTAITDVTFGLKTPEHQIKSIIRLFKSLGYTDIIFKKVFINDFDYKVDFRTYDIGSSGL